MIAITLQDAERMMRESKTTTMSFIERISDTEPGLNTRRCTMAAGTDGYVAYRA